MEGGVGREYEWNILMIGVLLLTLLSQRRLGPRLAWALEGGSKHMCPVVDLREWCGAEVTHLLGGCLGHGCPMLGSCDLWKHC